MIERLLQKAIKRDRSGRALEARDLYAQATDLIDTCVGNRGANLSEKLRDRYEEYKVRAMQLQISILSKVKNATICDYKVINAGQLNASYEEVFGKYLNNNVKEVEIVEPRIQTENELEHLAEFIEVMLVQCPNLKYISVKTENSADQNPNEVMDNLKRYLKNERNIEMKITYSKVVLKPRIALNNGFVICSTLGLHFYQDSDLKAEQLGAFNYNYRKCKANEVYYYKGEQLSTSFVK